MGALCQEHLLSCLGFTYNLGVGVLVEPMGVRSQSTRRSPRNERNVRFDQPCAAAASCIGFGRPNLVPIPGHVPLRGIALMLGATLFFASTDTITKTLTGALPAVEIAWLRYVIFTLIATTALLHEGGGAALRSHQPTYRFCVALGW